ncbi:hypothetical protein J0S82_018925 [Galemys pyrenaicus]|uniref:Uncharacterized protein n=1 Tax=Galemys pyrenaicus TaxID=202257 RepID=A0A8J6DS32_GALPY|nr:hypothetical protein J0S82_018925 [Galemys pyrenaicus]
MRVVYSSLISLLHQNIPSNLQRLHFAQESTTVILTVKELFVWTY